MALSINTNLALMTARASLRFSSDTSAVSAKRLATGLNINSAADNPSGVALSQGMTAKIRGTRQATQNAQDGYNFLNIRTEACNQARDIILQLRDLAVRASNEATMTASDLSALSKEASVLINALDQINASMTFNGKNVFDISFDTVPGGNFGFYNGGIKNISIDLASYVQGGQVTLRFAWFDGAAAFPDANLLSPDGTDAFGYLYGTAPGPQTVEAYTTGAGAATANNGQADVHGIGTMGSATSVNYSGYTGIGISTYVEESFVITDPAPGLWRIIIDNQAATDHDYGIFVNEPSEAPVNKDRIWIGVGSDDPSNALQIGFYEITSLALGVSADFSSASGARDSIDSLDAALVTLAGRMGQDGVNINNLQRIISDNEQQIVGMSQARSRITDTDMAAEIADYTKSRIQAQGSVAMAAQALSLSADRVLNLLTGQGIRA